METSLFESGHTVKNKLIHRDNGNSIYSPFSNTFDTFEYLTCKGIKPQTERIILNRIKKCA